jgi:homoaconitase/3-isopropylmalate dehydratase large subunit
LPVTHAEIIDAIDPAMQQAATDAEMSRRGTGLAYILHQLLIPDVQTQPRREVVSAETPKAGSGAVSASASGQGAPENESK